MHDNGGASDRAQGDGGWEYEFITTVPDEYACSICLKVLRDPKQIANCGHRFCAVCLSPILRYSVSDLYCLVDIVFCYVNYIF